MDIALVIIIVRSVGFLKHVQLKQHARFELALKDKINSRAYLLIIIQIEKVVFVDTKKKK